MLATTVTVYPQNRPAVPPSVKLKRRLLPIMVIQQNEIRRSLLVIDIRKKKLPSRYQDSGKADHRHELEIALKA